MLKISVIVPIYNVEKYLNRCIDSILAQTFTDFELILIDDGSSDNSGKICDDYKEKDSRVVVLHKVNGGVSAARNDGIKIAKGEYITFVDSDDYVKERYLEELFHNDVDLTVQSADVLDENGNHQYFLWNNKDECIYTVVNEEIIEKLFLLGILNGMCSKIFRRKIIVDNNLYFDCDLSLGEDTLFVINYSMFSKKIMVENKVNYCYTFYDSRSTLSNLYKFGKSGLKKDLIQKKIFAYKLCKLLYFDDYKKQNKLIIDKLSENYRMIFFAFDEEFLLVKNYLKNIKFLCQIQKDKDFILCAKNSDFIKINHSIKKELLSESMLRIIYKYTYLQIRQLIVEKFNY